MPERYSVTVPDEAYYRDLVKCQAACPVATAAGSYATAISRRDFDEAFAIAKAPNPFALVCGRICAHPCEDACRRGHLDKPVAIRALKRAAAQFATREHFASRPPVEKAAERRSQPVAVVGGGPAGMTAARDLAILGYPVTVFEAAPVLGGMMYLGIQEYRLPRSIIAQEVQTILGLGVEVRVSTPIGPELTLADLRAQGFQAIFLAIGAHKSRELAIEGAELDGVLRGVEFLLNINLGYRVELGRRVVVVGGGNVAVDVARGAVRLEAATDVEAHEALTAALDVARAAVRLGENQVSMICLERREEMPAYDYEIEEALNEGVAIHNSLGPRRIVGEGGKVAGLETIVCSSVFDASGRFNPAFVEGTEAVMPCDSVVLAIGQTSDLSLLSPEDGVETTPRGTMVVDPETLATTAPGIYAGGDVAFGPRLLIDAISDGQRAARSIHHYLSGTEPPPPRLEMRSAATRDRFDDYDRLERQTIPTLPVDRRIGFSEVETGYDRETAETEGSRCLKCFISPVFDSEKCVLCGGCADVCPHDCLRLVSLRKLEGDEALVRLVEARYGFTPSELPEDYALGGAIVKDEELCIRCGLCADRCPTGAITMEQIDVI